MNPLSSVEPAVSRLFSVRHLLLVPLLGAALFLGAVAPAAPPEAAEVDRLIRQLGSDQFPQRRDAAKRLAEIGEPAVAPLRKAAETSDDVEVRRRAGDLAQEIVRGIYAPLRVFEGHTDQATYAVFSPDGKRILSTSDDHSVRLWDAATGKELRRLNGHESMTLCAAFTADGKRGFSCCGWPPESADHSIRLWDLETGKELHRFEGHTDKVWNVALSPDGRRALSASSDKTVRLWDVDGGKELVCLEGHTDEVRSAVFSPDGRRALSSSHDHTLRLWPLPK